MEVLHYWAPFHGNFSRTVNKALLKQLLPAEHGSWAFVLEPMLILQRGHRWYFAAIGVGVLLLFLAFRPLRLVWTDAKKGKVYPRTKAARLFGGLCGLSGAALFAVGAWEERSTFAWIALSLAGIYAVCFLLLESEHGSLLRELLGAYPAVLVAGGYSGSLVVLLILALKATASISYVRAYIGRHDHSSFARWIGVALAFCAAVWAFKVDLLLGIAYSLAALHSLALGFKIGSPKPPEVGVREAIISACCALAWNWI